MEIAKLTFAQIKKLMSLDKRHGEVRIRLFSHDFGDHFYILEDYRNSDETGHAQNHFLFYLSDAADSDLAVEHREYETIIEAALYHAYRFVLNNFEHADSDNEEILDRHDHYKVTLRKLVGA
jgi:hypothetical protein